MPAYFPISYTSVYFNVLWYNALLHVKGKGALKGSFISDIRHGKVAVYPLLRSEYKTKTI